MVFIILSGLAYILTALLLGYLGASIRLKRFVDAVVTDNQHLTLELEEAQGQASLYEKAAAKAVEQANKAAGAAGAQLAISFEQAKKRQCDEWIAGAEKAAEACKKAWKDAQSSKNEASKARTQLGAALAEYEQRVKDAMELARKQEQAKWVSVKVEPCAECNGLGFYMVRRRQRRNCAACKDGAVTRVIERDAK